jgi:hypothetical protein
MARKNGNPGAGDAGAQGISSSEGNERKSTLNRRGTLAAVRRNLAAATEPALKERLARVVAALERRTGAHHGG